MIKKSFAAAIAVSLLTSAATAQQFGGHFMENWDADEDGIVTLDEARQRRADIFYTFDENNDGVLDASDYAMFDEARAADREANAGEGMGQGMQRVQGAMERDYNDLNGDGLVSEEEFLTQTDGWFAMMDRNGDGQVDTGDFGPGGGMGGGQGKGNGKG